tara:strand:+ start:389 stop:577 length:189 start_codon:yes stop_codon:yes gene_type:complete
VEVEEVLLIRGLQHLVVAQEEGVMGIQVVQNLRLVAQIWVLAEVALDGFQEIRLQEEMAAQE